MSVKTVTQFVGYVLSHTAAIYAEVGGATNPRIYHGNIPETVPTKPVINYMIVGNPRQLSTTKYRTHFQINVRDTNIERCWTIAGLVKSAFDNYQDVADGFAVQCGYFDDMRMQTEPNNVYVVPLDIYIVY